MSDQPPPPPPPPPYQPPPPPSSFQPPPPPPGAPPPPPPAFQPPPGYAPSATPGQVPQSYMPVAAAGAGIGMMSQLTGPAGWSIGFGLVSILVPIFTSFYFPIMPLFGLLFAVRAFQRGKIIGAIVGLVLNIIGGIIALISSGLIGG